jgi:hypothetical protein
VSPTATQVPTRSPTPSPESHVELPRSSRRYRSRSPTRSSDLTLSLPNRRSDDTPRRGSSQQPPNSAATRKPIIAQTAIPPRSTSPSKNATKRAPDTPPAAINDKSPHSLPQPLLQDLSLYTNPQFSPENDGTTLEELAHWVRLSKYHERKRANTRIRLQRSLVSTALSARLTRCGEIARRNLVDCFRGDDKKTFAPLYNAIHDVRKSCDELRRYALLEPEMESLQSPGLASSDSLDTSADVGMGAGAGALGSMAPFLFELSATSRETFLSFLTQVRTNPDYLATRICSLTSLELNALTSFHQGSEVIESVLPFHSRPSGRGHASASNRNSAHVPSAIERLLSFQRHDPLSALIHTCFPNSAGPDSAEDKRRTEIWATACARMIGESKSGSEPILTSVLNVWAAMRDWSGKSNMEWYLMKILEDGAFLLDRAEDQHGTRFNLSDWTQKDSIAAEEFYEKAVEELFEVVDDEDATGIPEGLIELGNEILKRLDSKYVDSTRRWFVYKWLFSVFLFGVVIHPESYGMMAEYHITEYGRQKILKQVAIKAKDHVIEMAFLKKTSIPLKVKGHVENILGRFRGSRSPKSATKLLPARSITSLRETVEVRPYLVISPADLVTLVNALHPERRPQSAQSSSLRSGAASISGLSAISQPISMTASRSNFDAASIISTSASSVISDATTSRDPLLEEQRTGTPQRYSPPVQDGMSQKRMSNYEDDGIRLRLAIHEMAQVLGLEASHGSRHPCAERWAVLFISSDGASLSTHMTYDPDDDADEEENSSTSDTDEDEADEKPELDKDYHQLRDSILKLVEDYEIPQSTELDGNKTQFSNRATGLKKYRSKKGILIPETSTPNRNPYRKRPDDDDAKSKDATPDRASASVTDAEKTSESAEEPQPVLIAMLTAASAQSRAQSDFVSAHLYWKTLQQLNTLSSESLRRNGFAILLNIFSRGPRDSLRRSASATEEYDAWLVWLKQSQERHEGLIDAMMKRLRSLRDKMWYVTDVRNSAPYEYSRNICVALKTMGMPRRWSSFARTRAQLARGPAANYLYRTEAQIMDLLAASEEQGGPNKLSDDQADNTSRWLQQYGIENFCKGEERIHRFCLEVENCIGKLVGDSIVDGPVLWSSELYLRDRKTLESTKNARDRDHLWGADDAASIISDPERRYATGSRPNSIVRDLRAMSALNSSQQSIDSRYSFSRASTALSDHLDGPDYFGVSSPVHTIDSSTTFWSPFQSAVSPSSVTSRAHSPTTSLTNLSSTFSHPHHQHLPSHSHQSTGRPGTSASSNETVSQQRLSEEKSRFLSDLRQSLTSLLLSDLGNLVFARGSETDGWFEGLGQQCIDRRESLERRARRAATKKDKTQKTSMGKPRVIEKKKSFGNLRGAGQPTTDKAPEGTETPTGPGHESSATSDTISARSKPAAKDATPEFPFKKAYQRLLRMFCVHPNPYTKLQALFELEHLIVASLTSSGSRRAKLGWARSEFNTTYADDHGGTGRANPLEDAIDNVKERRSNTIMQVPVTSPTGITPHALRAGNAETRSVVSANPANTDAIANVLQALFRDPSIRPKTLFRDLQFIAAFVPPSILDKTDRGKALWDTGLAALSLKQEVCRTMVEVADEVVSAYTTTRKQTGDSKAADESLQSTSPPPPATTYKLADAARMWTITAKEGDPTAQRELALFYLSNPELVERTTLPLSKPREVFKQTVMEKYGARTGVGARHYHPGDRRGSTLGGSGLAASGGSGPGGDSANKDGGDLARNGDVRNDPALMCVAVHWMEAAEKGGDGPATAFLTQNEFAS